MLREKFLEACKNPNYLRIINKVQQKYRNIIPEHNLKSCALVCLWNCLKSHDDKYGQKFTTSLWRRAEWACKQELKKILKHKKEVTNTIDYRNTDEQSIIDNAHIKCGAFLSEGISHQDQSIKEYIELLPQIQKKFIIAYYYDRKTMTEIGVDNNCSYNFVRKTIKMAHQQLKEKMEQDNAI